MWCTFLLVPACERLCEWQALREVDCEAGAGAVRIKDLLESAYLRLKQRGKT
jgi:hypothetical protein